MLILPKIGMTFSNHCPTVIPSLRASMSSARHSEASPRHRAAFAVISHADEPPKAMPGVMDLNPIWRPGWVCLWTVQNALRSAAIPEETLRMAEAEV
jgi:hypothetical protein